ncbi:hypothetical protein ACQJBY_059193 [Aegilops geniculata]
MGAEHRAPLRPARVPASPPPPHAASRPDPAAGGPATLDPASSSPHGPPPCRSDAPHRSNAGQAHQPPGSCCSPSARSLALCSCQVPSRSPTGSSSPLYWPCPSRVDGQQRRPRLKIPSGTHTFISSPILQARMIFLFDELRACNNLIL